MVDFEFDEKTYKRVDVDGKKFILVDNVQGSKMLFNRYPFRGKYDVYYGMMFYCCFPKGTKILGRSGISNYPHSYNIEDIKVGDKVLSYNEVNGNKEYKEVTKTFIRKSSDFIYLSFSNGNRLRLTSEHPIAVMKNGNIIWTKAGDIQIGDKVMQKESPSVNLSIKNFSISPSLRRKLSDKSKEKISSRISERNKLMWNDPNSAFNLPSYKRMKTATLERVGESTQSNEEFVLADLLEQNFPEQWIYNNDFYIGGCKPDFIHAKKNKVIEWNGCYYHGCEVCGYQDRKKVRSKDLNKKKVYNSNGYDLLTLWEHSSLEDAINKVEKFSFNPDVSIIEVIGKSIHFIEKEIGYEDDGWSLVHKNGVYSIWETIDGFIVKELRKTKEFFNKIGEAIAYVDVMNRSYSENVYNLEVKNNNNYFAKGILVHNCWEPILTKFIKSFVKPGMKTADVGVYLGYYSLMMAKLSGNEGSVYAFEPSSDSLDILMRSAEINGYNNIMPYHYALSNFDGVTDFDDDSFLIGLGKKDKEKVNVAKLDTLGIDIDFMKIDTDGYDGNVIAGAVETIKKNGTVVALEYFPQMWAKVGMKPSTFFASASSNNLNVFVLGDDCQLLRADINALLKYPNINHLPAEQILRSDYPDVTLILSTKGEVEINSMCKHV